MSSSLRLRLKHLQLSLRFNLNRQDKYSLSSQSNFNQTKPDTNFYLKTEVNSFTRGFFLTQLGKFLICVLITFICIFCSVFVVSRLLDSFDVKKKDLYIFYYSKVLERTIIIRSSKSINDRLTNVSMFFDILWRGS